MGVGGPRIAGGDGQVVLRYCLRACTGRETARTRPARTGGSACAGMDGIVQRLLSQQTSCPCRFIQRVSGEGLVPGLGVRVQDVQQGAFQRVVGRSVRPCMTSSHKEPFAAASTQCRQHRVCACHVHASEDLFHVQRQETPRAVLLLFQALGMTLLLLLLLLLHVLAADGYDVDYLRIPVTDEKAPKDQDFEQLIQRLWGVPLDAALIFNCQVWFVTGSRRGKEMCPGMCLDSVMNLLSASAVISFCS